jgi:hypothetical protein
MHSSITQISRRWGGADEINRREVHRIMMSVIQANHSLYVATFVSRITSRT